MLVASVILYLMAFGSGVALPYQSISVCAAKAGEKKLAVTGKQPYRYGSAAGTPYDGAV